MNIRAMEAEFVHANGRTDGRKNRQTDMMKLIVVFFATLRTRLKTMSLPSTADMSRIAVQGMSKYYTLSLDNPGMLLNISKCKRTKRTSFRHLIAAYSTYT